MLSNQQIYWGVLQSISGLGAKGIRKLYESIGNIDSLWDSLKRESDYLVKHKILSRRVYEDIQKLDFNDIFSKMKDNLQSNDIGVISYVDAFYPLPLTEIYNPPAVLFYKGNLDVLKKLRKPVAMVGARACSSYGKNVALYFSKVLAQNDVTIISGGARGIDTYSHQGALNGKGKTIAVMGCGLNRVYPAENAYLFYQIIKAGGLLLSEYAPGVEPHAGNFPARNRIIAGLARAVIVVEAKARSGSLITADMAINEGRDVFSVPGNVLNSNNDGSHWLLREGANVLTRPEDLLDEYGWKNEKSVFLEKDSSHKINSMLVFTKEERKVLENLSSEKNISLEELVWSTNLALPHLQQILLKFELKNMVEKTDNQGYVLKYSGRG